LTTFYGFDVSQRPRIEPAGYYHPLFADTVRALALSRVMQAQLIELGCPPDKAAVHHLGADADRFEFLPRQRRGDEPVRLISVSRLTEKKGIEYALDALGQILSTRGDFIYEVIGDGPLRPELEKRIADRGLTDHVQLLGWCRQDEVVERL